MAVPPAPVDLAATVSAKAMEEQAAEAESAEAAPTLSPVTTRLRAQEAMAETAGKAAPAVRRVTAAQAVPAAPAAEAATLTGTFKPKAVAVAVVELAGTAALQGLVEASAVPGVTAARVD